LQFFKVAEMTYFHFSHLMPMFVNMPFDKQDHILVKNLLKRYSGHKLLKEFPSKQLK